MSSGRTSWFAKDAGWYRRERIVTLIEEFGPAGAIVIDWLCCESATQDGYLDGTVKAGMATSLLFVAVFTAHVPPVAFI